jgi:hypothetical protein
VLDQKQHSLQHGVNLPAQVPMTFMLNGFPFHVEFVIVAAIGGVFVGGCWDLVT